VVDTDPLLFCKFISEYLMRKGDNRIILKHRDIEGIGMITLLFDHAALSGIIKTAE